MGSEKANEIAAYYILFNFLTFVFQWERGGGAKSISPQVRLLKISNHFLQNLRDVFHPVTNNFRVVLTIKASILRSLQPN